MSRFSKHRKVVVVATLMAAGTLAQAGGVTIPDFGVDGAAYVTALETAAGPGIASSAAAGIGIFGIGLVIKLIKRFVH